MGNTQSAPTPRRPPNKLSKPKTNSSTPNLLSSKFSTALSRRNSQTSNVAALGSHYSKSVDAVVGETTEKLTDESTSRKRMSLFRSMIPQGKALPLDINSGVESEFVQSSLRDKPVQGWPKINSVHLGLQANQLYYNPTAET